MIIRKFELKNNYLKKEPTQIDSQYSTFGYFDGMDTRVEPSSEMAQVLSVSKGTHILPNGKAYEDCDHFTLMGIRKDDINNEDEKFWEENDFQPLIFLTCIRLEKKMKEMDKVIQEIEEKYCAIVYYCLDSTDLIVAMRHNSYVEGNFIIENGYPDIIKTVDKDNKIQKCFSVMSVEQKILDNQANELENIKDEKIGCMLNCLVDNWNAVDDYIKVLRKETETKKCIRFEILGSTDVAIFLEDINIRKLFALYSSDEKKGLLTHRCQVYKDAFLNINTKLLVMEKIENDEETEGE